MLTLVIFVKKELKINISKTKGVKFKIIVIIHENTEVLRTPHII